MLDKVTSRYSFDNGLLQVNKLLAIFAAGIVMLMTILTVIDVLLRYLFSKPLVWNYDVQTYLIVGVAFLGVAYAQSLRRHISVDILISRLSRADQHWFHVFNNTIFLCFTVLVTWRMGLQAWDAFLINDYLDGIIRIPVWPAKGVLTLGTGLLSLTIILTMLQDFRELLGFRKTERSGAGWYIRLAAVILALVVVAAGTYFLSEMALEPVTIGWISILLVLLFLFLGTPIAATTGLISIWGVFLLSGGAPALGMTTKVFQQTLSYIMTVIPLFIAMGIFAGLAGFATNAYEAARRWLQGIPGGLIHATIAGAAMFGAATGASTAACATFAKMVLPEMFRLGVNKSLAVASVACSTTLATMIPPSLMLITYAMLTQQSVGKMLIAGIVPGLMQAFLYMGMIFVRCKVKPSLTPQNISFSWKEKGTSLLNAWGIVFIVIVVMGGIYTGVFTPIEAGSIGAFAAFVAAVIIKRFRFNEIGSGLLESVTLTCSIVLIIIGGMMFGSFLAQSRVPVILSDIVTGLSVHPVVIIIAIMFLYFIAGMFMDSLSILIITLPVVFPTVTGLGYDPIWFGILVTLNIEVSLFSPPYGLNLFVMKATVPGLNMGELYRGTIWFLMMDFVRTVILIAFPAIVLWLPNMMMG